MHFKLVPQFFSNLDNKIISIFVCRTDWVWTIPAAILCSEIIIPAAVLSVQHCRPADRVLGILLWSLFALEKRQTRIWRVLCRLIPYSASLLFYTVLGFTLAVPCQKTKIWNEHNFIKKLQVESTLQIHDTSLLITSLSQSRSLWQSASCILLMINNQIITEYYLSKRSIGTLIVNDSFCLIG